MTRITEADAREALEEAGWDEDRMSYLWRKGPLLIPFVELRRRPDEVVRAVEALEEAGVP